MDQSVEKEKWPAWEAFDCRGGVISVQSGRVVGVSGIAFWQQVAGQTDCACDIIYGWVSSCLVMMWRGCYVLGVADGWRVAIAFGTLGHRDLLRNAKEQPVHVHEVLLCFVG